MDSDRWCGSGAGTRGWRVARGRQLALDVPGQRPDRRRALIVGWRRLPEAPGQPIPRPGALRSLLVTFGIGALTLALIKSGDWGWAVASTTTLLIGVAIALALFVVDCERSTNPLIDPALFRVRAFSGASLIARFGPGPVIAVGSTLFAAGAVWWALSIDVQPNYASGMLGGMLLSGIGVGLPLPTFMATGTSSLASHLLRDRLHDGQNAAPGRAHDGVAVLVR